MVERPYFCAIAPEIVSSPSYKSLRTKNRPNSRNPTEAPSTDQEAAKPAKNASCAVPTVDFAPINSDIRKMPMIAGGSAQGGGHELAGVRLRNRTVIQLVNRI